MNYLIIISAVLLFLLFMIFMIFRSNWIYKQRIILNNNIADKARKIIYDHAKEGKLLKIDIIKWYDDYYNSYYSYNKMALYFWIWDIEKMRYK